MIIGMPEASPSDSCLRVSFTSSATVPRSTLRAWIACTHAAEMRDAAYVKATAQQVPSRAVDTEMAGRCLM